MAQGPAVRALTSAAKAVRRLKPRSVRPPGMLQDDQKEPTAKSVKKAKRLRLVLATRRAEAKPGAKLFDLGPPLTGLAEIAGPRMIRRLEIQDANEAIKKSLRESKGRRAEAKAKGRAYKKRLKPRSSHRSTSRSGGR